MDGIDRMQFEDPLMTVTAENPRASYDLNTGPASMVVVPAIPMGAAMDHSPGDSLQRHRNP